MHGDLVRAAKELDQLRAQMAAQAAGEAGYRDGYRDIISEVSAERDALRHELDQLCGSIRDAYAQAVEDDQQSPIIDLVVHLIEIGHQKRRENKAIIKECATLRKSLETERDALRAELETKSWEHAADVSKCSSTINALRAEVERLISDKFTMEAKVNAAIMGQRSLHSDMINRWDEVRDAILHGIDGLDNDQTNSVLGCIDDFYPTDIKPCSASEDSSVTATPSPAVTQMVEALEEARHYVAVYGNGGLPNELLDQMMAALDAAKGIK